MMLATSTYQTARLWIVALVMAAVCGALCGSVGAQSADPTAVTDDASPLPDSTATAPNQTPADATAAADQPPADQPPADQPPTGQPAVTTDAAAIEAGLEAVSGSALDDTQKAAITQTFQQAQQLLQDAENRSEQADQYRQMASSAAANVERLQQQIDQLADEPAPIPPSADMQTLGGRLTAAQAELQAAAERVEELAGEPARRQRRLADIPREINQSEQALAEAQEQLSRPPAANESELAARARSVRAAAEVMALEAQLRELKQEQAAYLATTNLLPLRRTLAERQRQNLRDEVDQLQRAITARQTDEANDASRRRAVEFEQAPAGLRPLAKRNWKLAQMQEDLIARSAQASQTVDQTQQHLHDVKAALKTSRERLDAVGLSDAMGLMLRNKRRQFETLRQEYLPDTDLRQLAQQQQVTAFKLEDELARLEEQLAARGLSTKPPSGSVDVASLSIEEAEAYFLQVQHQLLTDTLQAQNALLQLTLRGDTESAELREVIDTYEAFVDKNVFWIRSSPAFTTDELALLPAAAAWLTRPLHWQGLLQQFTGSVYSPPLLFLVGFFGLLILIYKRRPLRRYILAQGERVQTERGSFRTTGMTLAATIVRASMWPLAFLLVGWILLYNDGASRFVRGVGNALIMVALYVASRILLAEACRDGGLADKHFRWHAAIRKLLIFHLRWYVVLGAVLIFLMVVFHDHPDAMVRVTTARLTSVLLFLTTAMFHHVILRPSSPVYVQVGEHTNETRLGALRRLLWLVVIGLPLIFAGLAMAGYLDTAFRLGQSLQSTLLLLLLVLLLMGLMFRWLYLHRRAAARREAREMRRQQLAAATSSEAESLAADVGIELQQETMADLPKLDQQTRQLVHVLATVLAIGGLLLVWRDVFPAIDILDEWEAWSVGVGDRLVQVTLRDVLYALLGLAATVVAVRDVPGLLELWILRRTHIDSGARYALTTILRYALGLAGALFVLNLISVPWSQLGWLVAAASVGLGFGLQEIVANFVSGLILLLERPVRVGDVVTIDGTSGIVSRIQMRATTVTSWDRKELVVPNKDLITEKLLNWSLSSVVNRVVLEVGVAYGSNPDEVREILEEVVQSHPEVMEDPEPLINLESFGDSSLIFAVRFFLPNLDRRIAVTHDINSAITAALAKADIAIPFPQRDVHLFPAAPPTPQRPADENESDNSP